MKYQVIAQDTARTILKCPACREKIVCTHVGGDGPNDDIGRLDIGLQNYHLVVCMNRIPLKKSVAGRCGPVDGKQYCDHEGDFFVDQGG